VEEHKLPFESFTAEELQKMIDAMNINVPLSKQTFSPIFLDDDLVAITNDA
jgi:hypothetical protein